MMNTFPCYPIFQASLSPPESNKLNLTPVYHLKNFPLLANDNSCNCSLSFFNHIIPFSIISIFRIFTFSRIMYTIPTTTNHVSCLYFIHTSCWSNRVQFPSFWYWIQLTCYGSRWQCFMIMLCLLKIILVTKVKMFSLTLFWHIHKSSLVNRQQLPFC